MLIAILAGAVLIVVSVIASIFLYYQAKREEKEYVRTNLTALSVKKVEGKYATDYDIETPVGTYRGGGTVFRNLLTGTRAQGRKERWLTKVVWLEKNKEYK